MDNFLCQLFKRQRIAERFAAALKSEWDMNISYRKTLTVNGANWNTPEVGIHAGKLRNVRSNFSVGVAFTFPINFFDVFCETEKIRNDELVAERSSDQYDVRFNDPDIKMKS